MDSLAISMTESDTGASEHCILELETEIVNTLYPILDEFRTERRSVSPTFKFLEDILTRVLRPIKMFISATRKGC